MSKIFSKKNLLIITMAFFLFATVVISPVFANGLKSAQEGLNTTATESFGDKVTSGPSISQTIGQVIGYILSFVGVIFLVLIIYAGFTWMLARGNEAEVKKAKDLMYDAIIGLIIIMSAYAITAFVGGQLAN